jgi:hypothetical protein
VLKKRLVASLPAPRSTWLLVRFSWLRSRYLDAHRPAGTAESSRA